MTMVEAARDVDSAEIPPVEQSKRANKELQCRDALVFVRAVINGGDLGNDLLSSLRDGRALCKLAAKIAPATAAQEAHGSGGVDSPFRQMERIANFLQFARSYGVLEHELFETSDLYHGKNIYQVATTLLSLQRLCHRRGLDVSSRDSARGRNPMQSISSGNYIVGNCIGRGHFATVYKCLEKRSGRILAIKQVNTSVTEKVLKTLLEEVEILKTLDNPNIIRFYGSFIEADHLNIVLEYAEGGSLLSQIRQFGPVSEELAASVYIPQILRALICLHEREIIHCDLKCANILLTKDGAIKLSDFGIAERRKLVGPELAADNGISGTAHWLAPEVIQLQGASVKADIWALGATAVEMLTGSPPYGHCNQMTALYNIVREDHPPFPTDISRGFTSFLLKCFEKSPDRRPNASQLLSAMDGTLLSQYVIL